MNVSAPTYKAKLGPLRAQTASFAFHASRIKPHLLLLALCLSASAAPIDESQLPAPAKVGVDFTRDIEPIFHEVCWRCHGPERPKSHFRLDNRKSALKGGDQGIDIIPGTSVKSPLIHYVARLVPEMEMPPEGKGEPLTPEQIGLLRAWIDQGASWGITNPPVQFSFSAAPALRWVEVQGDKAKFRELEGIKEGFGGGLEYFSAEEQIGPDKKLSVEGRVLVPDNDFQLKLALVKTDVGFVRGGFEEWRRYYDDTGGYYRPFPVPSFNLGRDLHLDIGRAWIDFGLTLPRGPQMVGGYEYQFKEGAKSTLEWGSVNGKNIYPAAENLHEHVHILRFELTHEFADWRLEDSARVEFYHLQTRHDDDRTFTLGPAPDALVHTAEGATHVAGMNTVRMERQVSDWWLLSGGYLYSRFDGDASLNQTTTDSAGVPVAGTFWSSDQITLRREAHVFSVASLFQPLSGLSLSLGVQNEWQRQEAFGNISLDEGDPDLPQLFFLRPALVQSDLDKWTAMETAGLRYTKLPFTVLFAEARLQQEAISQFEQETPTASGEVLPQAFLRDTDATHNGRDLRAGFNTSPWRWLALNADFCNRLSDTDYDHLRRVVLEGEGYSAFIRHRKIEGNEAQAKLVLRPARWLSTAFTYRRLMDDYWASTDPVSGGGTPGGTIFAGSYRADVYGVGATFVPFQRLHLSGNFSYSDSRTATAQNGDLAVVPYRGNVYTLVGSARYALNPATELQAAYSFSEANYGQNNVADGLPLGLDFTRHGLMVGVTRRLSRVLTADLRYRFFKYSEPNTGGFVEFTAHGVFATLSMKWP